MLKITEINIINEEFSESGPRNHHNSHHWFPRNNMFFFWHGVVKSIQIQAALKCHEAIGQVIIPGLYQDDTCVTCWHDIRGGLGCHIPRSCWLLVPFGDDDNRRFLWCENQPAPWKINMLNPKLKVWKMMFLWKKGWKSQVPAVRFLESMMFVCLAKVSQTLFIRLLLTTPNLSDNVKFQSHCFSLMTSDMSRNMKWAGLILNW